MKLTRLRLHGFKSFVESTDILIEPGLTGVVGPNGCGKSNLVEAVKWVMGEASFKSMRASSMDEVIFSGSTGRPARNNAEVAVRIDNSDRSAPAAFNDDDTLEIVRRIEREAGSIYRINGREVRARDVQVLFADASTGARSPALVHQGRITEIIQAKPEQRRHVLEEAAGVAGLHVRRHEAELRLKATEANLTRLEDVIGQLAAQMDGLKKQARQAVRYRTVSAQVRKNEATLYHLRWTAAKTEVADANDAKDACVRAVAERVGAEAEASKRQALAAAALPELREAEARAGAALHRLNVAMADLDREEQRAKDRLAELAMRLTQLAADSEREQRLAAGAEAALSRLAAEEQTVRREAYESTSRRSGVDARTADADGELSAAEKVFSDLTTALADLTAQRNAFENAAREQAERSAKIAGEIEAIEREFAILHGDPAAPLAAAALEGAQAALSEAEAAAVAAEAAHNVMRAELEMTRAALTESEKRVQRLETEVKTLSKLLSLETRSLWPPVIDAITVEKGYEKALGAALGDDLDAPLDPSSPVYWATIAPSGENPALPQGVEPLGRYVTAPPQLGHRLAQIGVIERAVGERLAATLKTGQRLVSCDGDLWRWDGFVAAAHAPTGAARRLAQRNRFAELDAELASARAEVEDKRKALAAAEAAFAAAGQAQSETRARERDLYRQSARLSALAEARTRLSASREEATAARAQAERGLSELPPAAELERNLAGVRDEIGAKRVRLAEVRAEQQVFARESEIADRRLRQLAADQTSWSERRTGALEQMTTLANRMTEAERDRSELENAPQIFAEKRAALISEVKGAEAERQACADRLQEAENALVEADRHVRAALEAASAVREELARAEERLEAAKRRLSEIAREIHDMLEVEPEAVAEVAELKAGEALPEMAEVEERLEQLRRERERLGAVNLRAEEELREVEAQHTSLASEHDDLVEAIKKLRLGIQSLNREARERLLSSFEQVNRHFQSLFTKLFGGGAAELQLLESEDPLLAGLEIMAKPPGKTHSTLSLLSGGEQALAALALIFAVFLTNPAPICILDEAEASLDDYNVERFCDLLEEMARSTETRFVIITHNPITMARMNRLYGVTMAERGVSQLVSVDLEAAVRLREAV
jgi:chromosome segregation protein